jgi:hypothetical protein
MEKINNGSYQPHEHIVDDVETTHTIRPSTNIRGPTYMQKDNEFLCGAWKESHLQSRARINYTLEEDREKFHELKWYFSFKISSKHKEISLSHSWLLTSINATNLVGFIINLLLGCKVVWL